MRNSKVLFIGIDAMNIEHLMGWVQEGSLPTIQSLMEKGCWGSVENTPCLSTAAWPSCYTGCSVARHGSYYYNQIVPGTYTTKIKPFGVFAREPFWNFLSRSGKK